MTVSEYANVVENYVTSAPNYKVMKIYARNAQSLYVKYQKYGGHAKIAAITHALNA